LVFCISLKSKLPNNTYDASLILLNAEISSEREEVRQPPLAGAVQWPNRQAAGL